MNLRNIATLILLSLVMGGLGFGLSAMREPPPSTRPAQPDTFVDTFPSAVSFSEIENSKSFLGAECSRLLNEYRAKWSPALSRSRVSGPFASVEARRTKYLADWTRELERKIEEFKGTEQEYVFVEEQLMVLRWRYQHGPWLDTYLRVLYQRPGQWLVGRWANEAINISRAAGRERDVLEGFRHLTGIPLNFDVKQLVESHLAKIEADRGELLAQVPVD